MKLREILNPLINLPTEFENEAYGETCMICGFPFDKKVREEAVSQALSQTSSSLLKELEKGKTLKEVKEAIKEFCK